MGKESLKEYIAELFEEVDEMHAMEDDEFKSGMKMAYLQTIGKLKRYLTWYDPDNLADYGLDCEVESIVLQKREAST